MINSINAGDTAWVLISTALVLLMTVGLAFFYGGLVRPKSALNTMMMSVVALGLIGVQWVIAGYSLSFAPGSSLIGGFSWIGLRGVSLEPHVQRYLDDLANRMGMSRSWVLNTIVHEYAALMESKRLTPLSSREAIIRL